MSLIKSKQKPTYKWKKGDLITALDACELLGYKSANALNIPARREKLMREFESFGLTLTPMPIAGSTKYIEPEIQAFLNAKAEAERELNARHRVPEMVAA